MSTPAMSENAQDALRSIQQALSPFVPHLKELRDRLVKSAIALAIATIGSFFVTEPIIEILKAPMEGTLLVTQTPTEGIGTFMKVAIFAGLTIALPIIVYQALRFVLPALTKDERKYVYWIVPGATFSFVTGVAFAYYVMLPAAVPFLKGFLGDVVQPFWSIGKYISFITSLMLWIGVAFELPLVVYFLAKAGVVNVAWLKRNRKYAVVVVAILSAVITPTPDPFNMGLVMIPLLLLYEIGILLARLA
jgi:sec-independent protein translocase protein TatC